MTRFKIVREIAKEYKINLFTTYTLFSFEMLGSLLRPFFLGVAVNDLIKGSYSGLIVLSCVHLGWLIIGTFRHMYDTRTYSAIYSSLVTKFLSFRNKSSDISIMSAHSNLSRELVDFLETDLVYVIEALFNLVGSILLLFFYDSKVVIICFAILLPVIVISYFYGKKMSALNKNKNDELEKQVSIIALGNKDQIKKHYQKLRSWQIKISDKEAVNFGIIEIMVLLVISSSLLISSKMFGATILAGNLIGIYNYILKFVAGLDTIPYMVQRISSLNDIALRIEKSVSTENDINYAALNSNEKKYIQGVLKLSA
jgi:ABC-type multidrug transport system fused ATPase/permease subunit